MKRTIKMGLLAFAAAVSLLAPGQALAQQGQGGGGQRGGGQRGNFDPEQMRQRMEERMRESFGVKDDAEWKIIYERIQKVNEARRAVPGGIGGMGGMRGMFGGPPGGGPGGDNAPRGNRAGFGGQTSPEEEALAKAIENKASKEDLKAAMGKYRDARKAAEDKLAKAQDDLKSVLNAQQEATALRMGLVR